MLKTPQFYLLWLMYAFGAGAGLMIIAKLAKIVDVQAGVKAGFAFVALLAIGNAGGRIVAGFASDKIGRTRTMLIVFLFQAILIFGLRAISSASAFTVISILLGFNYGANLSLFPSITKDFYGLKNFGVNYGFVFTAWGIGGTVLSLVPGKVYDNAVAAAKAAGLPPVGNFYQAYTIAGILLLVAAALSFLVKTPVAKSKN
jgi:OFA family oxalate/formate antiporter-like MFS transporter